MITLPNLLSTLRIPLAFLFLQENLVVRSIALLLAMLSDALDGYLARRFKQTSRLGTLLDPLMDKFFVFFVLGALMREGKLIPWEAAAMLCRDVSVIIFGAYLAWKGRLANYQFRAVWCGKLVTFMQFSVLLGLVLHVLVPPYIFFSFIIIGLFALIELYWQRNKTLSA